MLYTEYVKKAIDLTIEEADNGLFYLEPTWKNILRENQLDINNISDVQVDLSEISEVLKLEVEKRNTIRSTKPVVIDWLYEVITSKVEPTILQEESNFVKQVTEFMKANHEAQTLKEKEEWEDFTNS